MVLGLSFWFFSFMPSIINNYAIDYNNDQNVNLKILMLLHLPQIIYQNWMEGK